jgi:hypothetical protein
LAFSSSRKCSKRLPAYFTVPTMQKTINISATSTSRLATLSPQNQGCPLDCGSFPLKAACNGCESRQPTFQLQNRVETPTSKPYDSAKERHH